MMPADVLLGPYEWDPDVDPIAPDEGAPPAGESIADVLGVLERVSSSAGRVANSVGNALRPVMTFTEYIQNVFNPAAPGSGTSPTARPPATWSSWAPMAAVALVGIGLGVLVFGGKR